MQNSQKEQKDNLYYYVFDVLYKDGKDLRRLPLIQRKMILKKFLQKLSLPKIRFSQYIVKKGKAFFRQAAKAHLEGIIGKKSLSTYQSKRSLDWVKMKNTLRQEVVISGFTQSRGSREKFGALLIGVYNNKKELDFIGSVRGGFSAALLQEVYHQLIPLVQEKLPFKKPPKIAAVSWIKPKLVCEVTFTEWTKNSSMRHPIFQGLRIDKRARDVKKRPLKSDKEKLSLTHLDKVYWPKEKYTKGDLLEYYEKVAPFLLPFLKDRPIVLYRFPNGIEDQGFYQKNIHFSHPSWIKTYPIQYEGKTDHYLLINDLRSLLFAVNLGSIDLHPFMSRCKQLEKPDYCVIDLDPHGISFIKVVEVALVIHKILEEIGVKHYCKTSGGKGLHIFIPLHAKYTYEQSRQFAELVSLSVHKKTPLITSLERNPRKRQKKVYLDCLQNRTGQTVVAPYVVRPRPKALVSTPLIWEEVNKELDPSACTMKTLLPRVKKRGDLFTSVLTDKINMKTALIYLQKVIDE